MVEAEGTGDVLDVAIVGGGPIGLELASAFQALGVDYLVIEARQIGHTMTTWPRDTHFFSSPERIAIAGVPIHNPEQTKVSGENYLTYLRGVVEQLDLRVRVYEPVVDVVRRDGAFEVTTKPLSGERTYRARYVVLAIGDMAGFNHLGIPGEDLPNVAHTLETPHAYFRTRLLVVGGKNSAVESALRCYRAGAAVAISYRRAEFHPKHVKPHLSAEVGTLIQRGEIEFLPNTVPVEIAPAYVMLAPTRDGQPTDGERIKHETDFVLLCTGFRADPTLFKQIGIELRGREHKPVFNEETMETNVPGLYVAGTATAGDQETYKVFIENSHVHVDRIVHDITGRHPEKLAGAARNYILREADLPPER